MDRAYRYFSVLMLILLVLPQLVFAQISVPVSWKYKLSRSGYKVGDTLTISITGNIKDNWYVYSSDFSPKAGPLVTTFTFDPHPSVIFLGDVIPLGAKRKFDEIFNAEYTYFTKCALFQQKVVVKSVPVSVAGAFSYQACTNGKCVSLNESFVLGKQLSKSQPADAKTDDTVTKQAWHTLLGFFLVAILAGFAAILTPCVFPMIPMTVSYFMHNGNNKSKARFQALVFALSIIFIYTAAGTIVSVTLGASFSNLLSTHWLPNVFFFLIFVVFAASFFGMFEIILPSWLVNKSDKQADKGGIGGAFFMAFTLVLVSFSCTGPIVGAVLVESANGAVLKPIVGMLGFSLSFALPFAIFAFFPALLHNIPKSGSWLNAVKVSLGFIELALALKFLSIADQTYHWGLLNRDVYIALWIVIFTYFAFYLLGKIRFVNDSPTGHIGVPRFILSIIVFAFVIYLVPGMFGAPLKALSGYLPPQTSDGFTISRASSELPVKTSSVDSELIKHSTRYSDLLNLPHGLKGYFDYKEALTAATEQRKPLFVDFTGHGCVNCREMEANVWSNPRVLSLLRNEFVVLALYVDDKTKLPEEEWYISDYDGKIKRTIGDQNADLQIKEFNVNAQPYYVLLDGKGSLLVQPKAYDLNTDNFVKFLEKGISQFKNRG